MKTSRDKSTMILCSPPISPTPTSKRVSCFCKLSGPVLIPGLVCGWDGTTHISLSLSKQCLENPVDRGAWCVAVHRVAQSRTRLKRLSMRACIGEGNGSPLQCSCLENPRHRGAWWAAVYGVAQSDMTEAT